MGSGGREHAIVKALSRSPQVGKIFCAPGNAGIADDAECVAIGVEDVDALVKFASENAIDMTVVGPEAALAVGVVDAMEAAGLKAFEPDKGCRTHREQQGVCKADNDKIQRAHRLLRSI